MSPEPSLLSAKKTSSVFFVLYTERRLPKRAVPEAESIDAQIEQANGNTDDSEKNRGHVRVNKSV